MSLQMCKVTNRKSCLCRCTRHVTENHVCADVQSTLRKIMSVQMYKATNRNHVCADVQGNIWKMMSVQMYKATVEQEEQRTPAYVRMQQEANAKEAEEEAEKKRVWEEEVASKKFWVCQSG